MSKPPEDPVLRSSRREAITGILIWACALVYTIGYCALRGYNRAPETITYVLGFPDWVFWGILAPWTVCALASFWFALGFMKDEPLGSDRDDEDGPDA